MLNHLKSHVVAYSLAAVVTLFFAGQAIIWSSQHETNLLEPQPVEAAVDVAWAEKFAKLDQESQQLQEQNGQLYQQNNQLYAQNDQLQQQNGQLQEHNGQLRQHNNQLNRQIKQLQEVIKEKNELAAIQTRELGLRHQQLANYEQALAAMKAQTPMVEQAVRKQTKTDAGLVKLARETLGVEVEVRECR
jgi:small-conductance mechanosensitive channel